MTKLKETALTSIALSILSANLFTHTHELSFFVLFLQDCESEENEQKIGYAVFMEEDGTAEFEFDVDEIVDG